VFGRRITNDGWQPCEPPRNGQEWKWATDRIEDGAAEIALLGRPHLPGSPVQADWMWPHQLARKAERAYAVSTAETEEKQVR
jgi:hypothetical protein